MMMGIILSVSIFTAVVVFAQTGAAPVGADTVTAPQVVAPAQPAGGNTVNAGSVTNSAGLGGTIVGNTVQNSSAQAAPVPPQGGMSQMLIMVAVMFGVMYFMAIRPQQKKAKEHQNLLSGLKSGDEVITNSGIIGTITGMSEKVVNLEISKNVQIKVLKSQVGQVIKGNLQDAQA